jgi:hypothetical protein
MKLPLDKNWYRTRIAQEGDLDVTAGIPLTAPKIRYCPYCGGDEIRYHNGVPCCARCRNLFIINYWRKLRAAPKKRKQNDHARTQ